MLAFSAPTSTATLPTSRIDEMSGEELLGLDEEQQLPPGDPERYFPISDAVLRQGRRCHDALAGFRHMRSRVVNQVTSLQWESYTDADGEDVDEEEDLRSQGLLPAVHNRLKPLFRHLKGMVRQNASQRVPFAVESSDQQAVSVIAEALAEVKRRNQSRALDADGFGELNISGMCLRRTVEAWDDDQDRFDIDDDPVHPNRFFFDIGSATDRRLKEVALMGEIIDAHPDEVLGAFARDQDMERALYAIYQGDQYPQSDDAYDQGLDDALFDDLMGDRAGHRRFEVISWGTPEPGRWRIYRIYRKEARWQTWYYDPTVETRFTVEDIIEGLRATGTEATPELAAAYVQQINAERELTGEPPIETEERRDRSWVEYHLSQHGHVLQRRENVYRHGRPPYSIGLLDFIDGEPRGFFEDILDVQKQINRTYAQIDAMISAGAKGLWAVPEEAMPKGMSKEEFASEFSRSGNILFYSMERLKTFPGAANLIKAIQPVSVPASIVQHLSMMHESLERGTGLTDATLGREPQSGTPASLYQAQISQGNTVTLDSIETYYEHLSALDEKIVSNIIQFWDDTRAVRSGADAEPVEFDPSLVEGLTWRVSIGKASETALYRQLFEQDLKDLMTATRITTAQYLQESSHPRAQALLQLIQTSNPLLNGAAGPNDLAQFAMMAEAGDPDAIALLNQAQEFSPAAAGMPTPNTA